ncbi:oocyte-secreted protein 2 [Callospermophilus lateralis]|uniref:oocyte-secreted protein 2 n=1 Tax=Callospermophilus lateralis TaxID=76772 RepID=UPI0040389338
MALEVLLFLTVLSWHCAESIKVKISFSTDWVIVSVSPFSDDSCNRHIFPDELFLRWGSPVTQIQTYRYDFMYPVHDCGIRTKGPESFLYSETRDLADTLRFRMAHPRS